MSTTADLAASVDLKVRYAERLARYTTAKRNEMPDRVPIRPFAAEFNGVYARYACQELAHNYQSAFVPPDRNRRMAPAMYNAFRSFSRSAILSRSCWICTQMFACIPSLSDASVSDTLPYNNSWTRPISM